MARDAREDITLIIERAVAACEEDKIVEILERNSWLDVVNKIAFEILLSLAQP